MKKILHLICNSHIDPVWQWDWDEGAGAALATFYAACNLLDKYDFVFCHNEVILYEYIEKYDPELFERIKKLIVEGKWKIMGGWYCQPDCFVPSGESFIRQITLGREYFWEKFGQRPTTALNFDSFGHTRGLPQILKKTGFDSYIFCRPMMWYVSIPNFVDYPHGPFLWEGYDGSRIKALRYEDEKHNYTTALGYAKQQIIEKEQDYDYLDIIPILWGVGNHGGLSSEKDLEDIMMLQDEKKGEWEIIHSSLEDYFAAVHPEQVEKRQIFVFSKAYSSINAIKLAHDQLENALYFTEKVCTMADIAGKYSYNKQILKDAERVLCQIEFHDVLAGTAIKTGMDSSIKKAYRAIVDLKAEMYSAFTALCRDLPKVPPYEENFVAMNPYPYEYNDFIEFEIYPNIVIQKPEDQYKIEVFDLNGNLVPFQIINEESNINSIHRVRLILKVKIPAMTVTSYHVKTGYEPLKHPDLSFKDDIVVKDKVKEVIISGKTGFISSFKVNGKEYLSSEASVPMIFNDNADPWGWRLYDLTASTFNECGWPQKELKNSLKPMKVDNRGTGIVEGLPGVSIIENGPFVTEVQALFYKGETHLVVNYKIYKDVPYIDVNYHILWNEKSKGLKLKFPLNGDKQYFAQMAFGIEKYKPNGIENPNNRYIGVKNGEEAFVIYNKSGLHSSSKKGRNLYLTLLNGASYCAHPTWEAQPLVKKGYFDASVEQGVHDFSLRLGVNKIEECERIANEFNQPVYVVSYYPHGDGKNIAKDVITLSNNNIVISALKRRNNGAYLIRLYNGSPAKAETELRILNKKLKVRFGKFEFKTFVFDGKEIFESEDSSIY